MNGCPIGDSRAGDLVTETFASYEGRQVSVYVPLEPPQAIVYAGDGQIVAGWGRLLDHTAIPPTLVVGVHGLADETARLREYSPGFDADRFAAHERFVVDDVRRWTEQRFGVRPSRERTAIYGASAGAELALALGLRHPEVYGAILCASPGAGYRPPSPMPALLPRAYLVAGTLEPFFLDNATRWSAALHSAGAHVVMTERAGAHGDAFWREEFALMLAWAFAA